MTDTPTLTATLHSELIALRDKLRKTADKTYGLRGVQDEHALARATYRRIERLLALEADIAAAERMRTLAARFEHELAREVSAIVSPAARTTAIDGARASGLGRIQGAMRYICGGYDGPTDPAGIRAAAEEMLDGARRDLQQNIDDADGRNSDVWGAFREAHERGVVLLQQVVDAGATDADTPAPRPSMPDLPPSKYSSLGYWKLDGVEITPNDADGSVWVEWESASDDPRGGTSTRYLELSRKQVLAVLAASEWKDPTDD